MFEKAADHMIVKDHISGSTQYINISLNFYNGKNVGSPNDLFKCHQIIDIICSDLVKQKKNVLTFVYQIQILQFVYQRKTMACRIIV